MLLWQEDRFFQRETYDGPRAVTVYLLDTSSSQALSSDDEEALYLDRVKRIRTRAEHVAESQGILLISNFAADASGRRSIQLDLGDEAISCRTVRDDGSEDPRCREVRGEQIDRFLEREFEGFYAGLQPSGLTDLVNGAFGAGALVATSTQIDAMTGPRRLVIESDFIETACDPFRVPVGAWPTGDAAVAALQSCAVSPLLIDDLDSVELVGLQLSADVTIAEVERAASTFMDFCVNLGGRCERGV